MEALNLARVPTTSKWRQAGNVYYPSDIRKVPAELPPPATLALVSSEQPLITQAPLPPTEVPKRPDQAGDQGQGVEVNKDKGKGKEVKPLSEAKDPKPKDAPSKAKDAAVKAKKAEAKSTDANPKAKNDPASQSGNKEDPSPNSKAQLSILFFCSSRFFVYM